MEIVGTDFNEKEQKSNKTMKIIIIAIVFLLIISVVLGGAIYYLKLKDFKLNIDSARVSSKAFSSELFEFKGEKVYVSLKDIAELINYKYYNGGYKQYTEDQDKCYLECDNEVTIFERDSNKIYKTPVSEVDYTYYTISEPIVRLNGKLYINMKDLGKSCNLKIGYNNENNTVTIYTLPYLVEYYTKAYSNASIDKNFNNQKALLYDLLIVQNIDATESSSNNKAIKYGVNDLKNETIIGTKYTSIEFIEGTEEFIVKTDENKVGLITARGETRVNPQYDALKQIDKDLNLYLATNKGKSGIIERNGKILIYLEYDQIGVDTTQFPTNDIKNKYILYNNAIPVKQNNKWGLFNIEGKIILPLEYDTLGCIARTSSDKTLNNILVIPEVEGIVVGKTSKLEARDVTYYGIVDSKGKELIPIALEIVYSTMVNGQEEYTMTNVGNYYNVVEFLKQQNEYNAQNNEEQSNNNNEYTNVVNEENNTYTNATNVVNETSVPQQNVVDNNQTQQTTTQTTTQENQNTQQQSTQQYNSGYQDSQYAVPTSVEVQTY